MTLRKPLGALRAAIILACIAAVALTPANAAAASPKPAANGLGATTGLAASTQLAALSTAIAAAPAFFTGHTNTCVAVTAMLSSQESILMAGNFRDAEGNCYVWLNLHHSADLTGSEICKLGLHEMGHLNGLEHVADSSNVMHSPFNSRAIPSPCVASAPKAARKAAHVVRSAMKQA
jgi:hypothetical protein